MSTLWTLNVGAGVWGLRPARAWRPRRRRGTCNAGSALQILLLPETLTIGCRGHLSLPPMDATSEEIIDAFADRIKGCLCVTCLHSRTRPAHVAQRADHGPVLLIEKCIARLGSFRVASESADFLPLQQVTLRGYERINPTSRWRRLDELWLHTVTGALGLQIRHAARDSAVQLLRAICRASARRWTGAHAS